MLSNDYQGQYPPQLQDNEYYFISQQGLARIAQNYDPKDPARNIIWSSDYTLELPIRMTKSGPGSEQPQTLVQQFQESVAKYGERPALSVKKNNQWQTINFKQYYQDCCNFAKGLISLGVSPYKAVNIIGFNAPQWIIAFYGSIFGFYIPVGIYTNNSPEACGYITQHSECELVVVENRVQLAKYLSVWDSLPELKYVVIYNDADIPESFIPENRRNQILQWNALLKMGQNYQHQSEANSLEYRMKSQQPGNCCSIVYTSGTTGQPKGVLLTHDSYSWSFQQRLLIPEYSQNTVIVSYLPLSHVAAQAVDIIMSMLRGGHVYFANPDALQGSILATLKEVRPTLFFSVPRIWEKIDEQIRGLLQQNGFIKKSITKWAQGIGKQGTFAEAHLQSPPFCFGVAKSLVYNDVKKAIGLDKCEGLSFGAAPLSPIIQNHFLSLNMFLKNGYGMSECSGGHTMSQPEQFDKFDRDSLDSTGKGMPGTQTKIFNPDKEGNGEICYRGRHIFRGYLKNEQATRETIDNEGYLHSGDIGKLDKHGNLTITGRIKEIIITAGGENIAPNVLENEVQSALKFVSNCMVVGEGRKFLAIFLTLKHVVDKTGRITSQLDNELLAEFKRLGSSATNFEEAIKCPIIKKTIQQGIEEANKRAVSKAHHIRKWTILEGDFSILGGEFTPNLKLKRKFVQEKNQGVIESLFLESKL